MVSTRRGARDGEVRGAGCGVGARKRGQGGEGSIDVSEQCVESSQVNLTWDPKSSQVKPGQARSCQVKSGQVELTSAVRADPTSSQVRPSQVKSGQVRSHLGEKSGEQAERHGLHKDRPEPLGGTHNTHRSSFAGVRRCSEVGRQAKSSQGKAQRTRRRRAGGGGRAAGRGRAARGAASRGTM
jgi:hypothetical protein